jgi:3-isopropylmalate dehydrogenase
MMLENLGETEAAARLDKAVLRLLESGKVKSLSAGKMGMSTSEIGDWLASNI